MMGAPDSAVTPVRLPWTADAAPRDYATLRARYGPIGFDAELDAWLVLGYDAARTVLSGRGWTSDPMAAVANRHALAAIGLAEPPLARTMLLLDGDDHVRQRGSVRDVFTPDYVAQLAAGIEAIADDILDPIPAGTVVDLMTEVAQPFPIAVIAEWLGLDLPTARVLWAEAAAIAPALDGLADVDAAPAAASAFTALIGEFLPLAAGRRAEPQDDLLSLLAVDPRLDLDEVVVNAILLAVAGHETTANLLGGAVSRLLDDTGGTRLVDGVDVDDPGVVDEVLRLDGPAQAVFRVATSRHEIAGHAVEPGERAVVVIAAANRDPDIFDDPDRFRIDRDQRLPNLAFGHGPHRCLGAALARLEVQIMLRALILRDPELAGTAVVRDTAILRGFDEVPILFRKGQPS